MNKYEENKILSVQNYEEKNRAVILQEKHNVS